jgi:hypothetical protein
MPIITLTDLQTNLYTEVLDRIIRGNDAIATAAIATAEQEVRMYLTRYDTDQLLGTLDAPPPAADPLLARLVKDIACWHIVRLANGGADISVFRMAYTDALNTLAQIRDGKLSPQGWPYATVGATPPAGNSVAWSSNHKRENHY